MEAKQIIENAIIANVSLFNESERRFVIELVDKDGQELSFSSYDKDGKETKTNSFSVDLFVLTNLLAKDVMKFKLLKTLALGKELNPQIVALCLIGANVAKIEREHKEATDLNEQGKPYGKPIYKLINIEGVKLNIDSMFEPIINDMIKNNLTIKKTTTTTTTTTTTSDPFAV